jgi:hypothetical protein
MIPAELKLTGVSADLTDCALHFSDWPFTVTIETDKTPPFAFRFTDGVMVIASFKGNATLMQPSKMYSLTTRQDPDWTYTI